MPAGGAAGAGGAGARRDDAGAIAAGIGAARAAGGRSGGGAELAGRGGAAMKTSDYLTPQPPLRSGEGEPEEHRLPERAATAPVGHAPMRAAAQHPSRSTLLRSPLSASERGLGGEVEAGGEVRVIGLTGGIGS